MKIPRQLIGKDVKVIWKDPTGMKVTSSFPSDHRDLPRGRSGLAKWTTLGLLEDLTDGVLLLRKSLGEDPIVEKEQTHSLEVDYIPEELVVTIIEKPDGIVHGEPLATP